MDPRERYSNCVREYILYRPGYPKKAMDLLVEEFGLGPESVVADIGAGTGKFTGLFDKKLKRVYAVEPNDPMRLASVEALGHQDNFVAVKGDAENTTLGTSSVDLVVSAHAFHYFDRAQAKAEFHRILKQEKNVALIWNRRHLKSPFLSAFDKLLRNFAPEFTEITHHNLTDDEILGFFQKGRKEVIGYSQRFDLKALYGRLTSSVYCPPEGDDNREKLFFELEKLFNKYEKNGLVDYPYDTEIFCGRL